MKNEKKQLTIYDISKRAGVSTATVSRVMNGTGKVHETTREKVLKAIAESGYEPNAFARGLGSGTSKTVGILCADVDDLYLARAVSFLERDLRKNGFITMLNCTGYDYDSKKACMSRMLARKVDAVILVGSHYIENSDRKNQYIRNVAAEIPVMLLNGELKGENIYCSVIDDVEAYREGTAALLAEGRQRILFLYWDRSASKEKKQEGYWLAHKQAGLEPDPSLILGIQSDIRETCQSLAEAWEKGLRFDGAIATSDEHGLAVLKFAKSQGIRVPEELSVIGCDNSVISICSEPELTSIDNKCEMLCVNTVSSLMMVLNSQNASRLSMMKADVVWRRTTLQRPE